MKNWILKLAGIEQISVIEIDNTLGQVDATATEYIKILINEGYFIYGAYEIDTELNVHIVKKGVLTPEEISSLKSKYEGIELLRF